MVRPGYYRRSLCERLYKIEVEDGLIWMTDPDGQRQRYNDFPNWVYPQARLRAVYYTFVRPLEEERNETMWQVGDQFRFNGERNVLYKIHNLDEQFVWLTWSGDFNNNEPMRTSRLTLLNCFKVNPEPEADAFVEAAQHAVVYMAYTQSRNTNTVTIISHIDEERFNAMLRAQEGQGFRTLAKKKIKFTI